MKLSYNSGIEGLDALLYGVINNEFDIDDDIDVIHHLIFIDVIKYLNRKIK